VYNDDDIAAAWNDNEKLENPLSRRARGHYSPASGLVVDLFYCSLVIIGGNWTGQAGLIGWHEMTQHFRISAKRCVVTAVARAGRSRYLFSVVGVDSREENFPRFRTARDFAARSHLSNDKVSRWIGKIIRLVTHPLAASLVCYTRDTRFVPAPQFLAASRVAIVTPSWLVGDLQVRLARGRVYRNSLFRGTWSN